MVLAKCRVPFAVIVCVLAAARDWRAAAPAEIPGHARVRPAGAGRRTRPRVFQPRALPPKAIYGIEVYHASDTPAQFTAVTTFTNACGSLVIWTK